MNKLSKLLQQCWVERAGPIPWPRKSCDFTLLGILWSNITEHIYIYIHTHRVFHDLWTLLQEVISLVFVIKKVPLKHVSDFGQLRNYGHFFNSRKRAREPRLTEPAVLWCTQIGGLSFALQALFATWLAYQLQTVQFPYLETWKVFKECREVGW